MKNDGHAQHFEACFPTLEKLAKLMASNHFLKFDCSFAEPSIAGYLKHLNDSRTEKNSS
jgi:hypothetical protein